MNPLAKSLVVTGDVAARGIDRAVKGFSMLFMRSDQSGYLLLPRSSRDYGREVGDAMRNSAVVAVIGWIARNFPEAPVRIKRLADDGSATYILPGSTGPGRMLQLLERPNPYYSGVLQWIATIVDLYSTGNSYWIKVREGAGGPIDRVAELWWAPSRMLRPAWPEDGTRFISHYVYTIDGIEHRIAPWDVIHFRDGIDPNNPRLGRSRMASLLREIYTDDEASNFTAALLTNMGIPGVVISPSNTAPNMRIDAQAVKQSFMEKYGGDKRGEPMVLTAPTDVKILSFNPQQLELRELRKLPEERISAVTGVAAIVAGLGAGLDRSTFSNFGEARRAAYTESVIPLQRLISAELEQQLLVDFADLDAGWDVDFDSTKASAMQEAWDAVWKRAESAAAKGLITIQDFQRTVGMPVDEDAPEVYLRPMMSMEVVKGEPAPTPPTPALRALEARNEAKIHALHSGLAKTALEVIAR